MKILITGENVRVLRKKFGLDVAQFASVLAVHPGTVERWEASGTREVSIDGVAASVISAMNQRLKETGNGEPAPAKDVGQEIAQALVLGGALVALGILIAWATKAKR